jgi:sugar phosphate isomerase/epimerase
MDIGICTTDFAPHSIPTLFSKIKQYGFTQVQFNFASIGQPDLPAKIDHTLICQINQAVAEQGLDVVAINGTFNMIDPDQDRLEQNIERFSALAAACPLLHCPILTLCTGTNDPDDMWRWHPENRSEASWNKMLAAMEQILPVAERYQLYLGVETEASNVVFSSERARKLLDTMQSPWLKIIMDCANLFQPGMASVDQVRPTIKKAFDDLGPDIILAHGKDIMASPGIVFASPGHGILDYDYFLDLLMEYRYSGGMILHGIKDESEMPGCLRFMKEKIARVM